MRTRQYAIIALFMVQYVRPDQVRNVWRLYQLCVLICRVCTLLLKELGVTWDDPVIRIIFVQYILERRCSPELFNVHRHPPPDIVSIYILCYVIKYH